jgi:hypothetical protein
MSGGHDTDTDLGATRCETKAGATSNVRSGVSKAIALQQTIMQHDGSAPGSVGRPCEESACEWQMNGTPLFGLAIDDAAEAKRINCRARA